LDEKEFLEKIEQADSQLASQDIPVYARDLHAFKLLAPNYVGPLLGAGIDPSRYPKYQDPSLLKEITAWYKARYGTKRFMPSDRARVPILLREEIYLIRIPFIVGSPHISMETILGLVRQITPDLIQSLSDQEMTEIRTYFQNGSYLAYLIEDLRDMLRPGAGLALPPSAWNMFQRGVQDRDLAERCLQDQPDTNGCAFHSQQTAEKFLKTLLLISGQHFPDKLSRKPYAHDLLNLYSSSCEIYPYLGDIKEEVGLLSNITMDIRYSVQRVTKKGAVNFYWMALKIGGEVSRAGSKYLQRG
jgi:hypothetical protein